MRIGSLIGAFAAFAFSAASHADVVYDNLITPLGNYLGGFAYEEVADDVTLGPGSRVFVSAEIAYAGFNFDGDETLTLTLYAMDGAPTPGSFGFNTPGTALFTQTLPIVASDGTTVLFSDATGLIILPDYLGIGLSFGGIDFDPTGAGSDAGPLLYDPPAVGSSFDDYWLRGFPNPGDDWGLFTFGGSPPINIGALITTEITGSVPEPSTLALLAIVAAGFARRRRKQ